MHVHIFCILYSNTVLCPFNICRFEAWYGVFFVSLRLKRLLYKELGHACCCNFVNGIVLYFISQIECHGSFQVNKKSPDLAAVGRSEGLVVAPADPLLRITQLEQNIRFLQDQHKLMLTSLHQEVEQLRQRNRGKQRGDML